MLDALPAVASIPAGNTTLPLLLQLLLLVEETDSDDAVEAGTGADDGCPPGDIVLRPSHASNRPLAPATVLLLVLVVVVPVVVEAVVAAM
uniref:Secreted protein n=1 Tax=Anopheles darlingi TaxID=43151 RepID=A0A2M4DL70_ANODA